MALNDLNYELPSSLFSTVNKYLYFISPSGRKLANRSFVLTKQKQWNIPESEVTAILNYIDSNPSIIHMEEGEQYVVSVDHVVNFDDLLNNQSCSFRTSENEVDLAVGTGKNIDGETQIRVLKDEVLTLVKKDENTLSQLLSGSRIENSDDVDEGSSNLYFSESNVSSTSVVQANSSKVSADGSVTTHSDILDAGSGSIISDAERNIISNLSSGGVSSINAQVGDVVLDSDDITEGVTNLYLTSSEREKILNISDNINVIAGIFNGNSSGILYEDDYVIITWLATTKQPLYELKSTSPIDWIRNTIYAMKTDGSNSTSNGNSGFRRTSGRPNLQLDTPKYFSRSGNRDSSYDLENSGSYLECALMKELFVTDFPAYRFYFNAGATSNVSMKMEIII